ncbi:CobW family GTP-binding protein [Sporohalobacter salinus]|uniref:CobW family GTP-binding protein n=1 Tax=Sporohalobacter salinus TaxID=1494606 RepID=UPI001960C20D|nr:GTP-binding protein [Sporohalobacter salinus]MBM7625042.1 G3E family GTPase [Sporohalobacter salinus]
MIKIDVISGFLGVGKTTLIRKLLKSYKNEKVIVIENEFGEIGIDGDLIESDGFEVFEIAEGCICCTMQRNFVSTLKKVIENFSPERIIIEPTGVNILSEIIEILNKSGISDKCSINSLITIIDSVDYFDQSEVFGEFFEDQIVNASTLLLSKSQFADEEKIANIVDSLKSLNESADIITTDWNELSLDKLKMISEKGDVNLFGTQCDLSSKKELDTFTIEGSAKYSKKDLKEILDLLKKDKYGDVIRTKGFLKGDSSYLEFSYTNGQYFINEIDFAVSNKICCIGENLDERKLEQLFMSKEE